MIKHIKCDIFKSGADIICHQVNCQGAMNSGIAKQAREKYPDVYNAYISICRGKTSKELLGYAQPVYLSDLTIVNLFTQDRYGYDGKCYTDYFALREALSDVERFSKAGDKIAIPYLLGCCRGGGDWNVVSRIIEEVFEHSEADVLICEYNGG